MPHILIAGKLHASGLALLDREGVTHDYVPDADPEAYLPFLPKADGLVLRTQPLQAPHLDITTSLKVVSRHGVGYDAVNEHALAARGIPLAIVGDVNSGTVAEHALMLMLAVSHRLVPAVRDLAAGDWAQRNSFAPRELAGQHLLIIGYGRIGQKLAALAMALGMTVSAYDPFATEQKGLESDLGAALGNADFVSLHIPAVAAPVLGAREISALKPGAIVINTARGGAIDEVALASALETGQVGGAGLDVLAHEPMLPDDPLFGFENVVITPHAAGLTAECAERMAVVSVRNVLDFFDGKLDPSLVVNGVTPPVG